MADWLKPAPHQWEMVPKTRTETRHEMNVRESCHTVMLWPKRYYDIDTGKFDIDRIETIESQSISELWNCRSYSDHTFDVYRPTRNQYPDAWFFPKDGDFDREEKEYQRKKDEQKKIREERERERQEAVAEMVRYAEERLRLHNQRLQIERDEIEYQARLLEAEQRAMDNFNRERENQMQKWANRTNIRPNCWRPK